jgi:YVTN family beta-propeller protein
LVGTTEVSWGTAGIAVQGRYAYTTGYHANPNFLRVVDVSNPASPFSAAAFTLAGAHPQAVAVQGPYAYMLDYGTSRLEVIDVSDPTTGAFSPDFNTSPSSLPLVGGTDTGAGPSSLVVRDRYAYVVSAVSGTVEVIDLADPAHPTVAGRVGLGAAGASGTSYSGIAVQGSYAYVADSNADALRVIDVTSPTSPSVVASVPAGQGPSAIAVRDHYAFVTNKASNTLQVYDIGSPTAPVSLGTVPTGAAPSAVAVSGHDVLVANYASSSLQIFDMSGVRPPITPQPPVTPKPPTRPELPRGSFSLPSAASLPVTKKGTVRFKVRCTGKGRCVGRARLRIAGVTIGAAQFSIAGGRQQTVTIRLNWAGHTRLRGTKGALRARLTLTGTASGRKLTKSKNIKLAVPPPGSST